MTRPTNDAHTRHLARAVELSRIGMRADAGYPFGAVVVRDGSVVAEAYNRVVVDHDPTAHAEIEAIRAAGVAMGTHDLTGCVLYASGEPCPMCLAALYWAGIDTIYYAGTVDDAAAIDFDDRFIFDEFARPAAERKVRLIAVDPMREAARSTYREWAERNGIDIG
jgi:tRNA(Arg) A34 adenosine deaminase TadA